MNDDAEHDHKWVFIRQEYEYEGGWKPDRITYDVYYCEVCLAYRRVKILREMQSRERFGWDVVERFQSPAAD